MLYKTPFLSMNKAYVTQRVKCDNLKPVFKMIGLDEAEFVSLGTPRPPHAVLG